MSLPALLEPGRAEEARVTVVPVQTTRSPYLVGPRYDWALFLLPPLAALALGIAISGTPFALSRFTLFGQQTTPAALLIGSLIHAHLVAVVFRSHVNGEIFHRHTWRFVLIPVLAWIAIRSSSVLGVAAIVLATFWDVWHSGLQTFGFARIYDRNAGNPPEAMRRLDFWLNHLLYAGPILAGATMLDHFGSFEAFEGVGVPWLAVVPARMSEWHRTVALVVLLSGAAFLAFYVWSAWRIARAGYRVSPLKVFLLVSTGAVSLYTWGFNSWGEAFFIMNLFHAVQYLGLVWALEGRRLVSKMGRAWAVALFFVPVLAYGIGAEVLDPDVESLWALTIVVSLMHFWYDGFVWSVRREQVWTTTPAPRCRSSSRRTPHPPDP